MFRIVHHADHFASLTSGATMAKAVVCTECGWMFDRLRTTLSLAAG
jgi:hypothetical protein